MNIWLVGGTTVIPQSVQDAMSGAGYTVNRINGSDRYETAKLIAAAGAKISGKQPSKVFVASGTSFADALAVSPIAYAKGYAIALTDKDSTSQFTKDELGVINTQTKILVGGTAVVSDSVAQNLTVSQRIAGADRGVTANMVADYANANEGFNASQAALVGGTNGNGADSLVGASVLGKTMTALHFAGWDSTTQWFKDHSAALTGAGVIFGGQAAVSDGMVGAVQSAAQSVAAAVGMIVTSVPTGNSATFGYADPVAKQQTKVTPLATDKFFVAGAPATQGAFTTSLTVGATVVVTAPATTGGPTTYSLTPAPAAGYQSGVVGAYTPSSGSGVVLGTSAALAASSFAIVEPITGVALNTVSYASATYTLFTVDGQSVSQAVFESSMSVGDTIAVTGTGADASHIRTLALASGSLAGTVSGTTTSGGNITSVQVKTTAGATLNVPAPTSTDTVTVDGNASTSTSFNTVTGSPVSNGDQLTYARAGGVGKFSLMNAAPSTVSGTIVTSNASGTTGSSGVAYFSPAGTAAYTSFASLTTPRYIVNGVVAAQADFVAAATAGSWITYQPADTTTNTMASLTVASKPLTGSVMVSTNTTSTGAVIMDPTGDMYNQGNGISFTSNTSVFSSGTSLAYSIDGTTATASQFGVAIGRINSGARTGIISASIANGVVTWSLATTANTSNPVIASVTGSVSAKTVTVTFSKPILTHPAAGTTTDWTVTGAAGAATSSWDGTGTILTLTFATSVTAGNVTVTPASTTTAATYQDVNGTAIGMGLVSGTAS